MIESVCSPWSQQKFDILTADNEILHGWSIGTITLVIDSTNPMKADVLDRASSLLGFNMLIEMYILKMWVGVNINQSNEAICMCLHCN